MKILLTGMNKSQSVRSHYLRMQLKIVPAHYSLFNALVDMGHDVEQREVEIGEDLSNYDEVIVYIAGPRQLVATHTFRGLWAISQRPDCILGVDDWQAPDLFKGLEKCRSWDELTCDFILGVNKTTIEAVLPHKTFYLAALERVVAKKNRMLVCGFDTTHLSQEEFGPRLLFDSVKYPQDRIYTFNPNPYHRNRKPGDFAHDGKENPHFISSPFVMESGEPLVKQRRFNFASLVQSKTQKWLKKQGYTGNPKNDEEGTIGSWPVDLYGSKAETQKRLTEDEMCKIFQRDWACLMPGYEHAGSGWWRARPLQAADAGCILIGERKELMVYYGEGFPFIDLKAQDLIDATDDDLNEILTAQQSALHLHHPLDKAIQRAELAAVLEATK